MKNKNQSLKSKFSAFTIVELLIVIVIIGILAAITIISYTGITKKANESTVQAELSNAKKQISLYYAEHGVYPKTLGLNNCLSNNTVTPDPDTKYCLKSSGGSTFTLTDATGSDYTLTLTKGTDIAYKVTKDTGPTSTTAVAVAGSFVKTWGGSESDIGQSIISTNDGGYAIVGYTSSYGVNTTGDMVLTKFDSLDNLIWSRTWGGPGSDYGYSLVQTIDGGFAVTGYTGSYGVGSNDMFIAKFDGNGALVWNKTWGGSGGDFGYSLVQSSDGGFVVVGYTANYGAGSNDVFIVKYDLSGNFLWNKTWGGASDDSGLSITQTTDGGYVLAGYTFSYGVGSGDLFLVKLNSVGDLVWNKVWGGTGSDYGAKMAKTANGGIVVTGLTNSYGSNIDTFIVKFDASGNLLWNKTWGGAGEDRGQSIFQGSDSGYVLTGYTTSFGSGDADVFLLRYDIDGNLIWNKVWKGASGDVGYGVFQTNDGGYIVAGQTSGYGAGGASDILLAKFTSIGNINNCTSPMCQTPAATAATPSATITTPSATMTTPTVTITNPTATVTNPMATITTVVAP